MRSMMLMSLALLAACAGEAEPPLVASDVVVTRPMPGMQMSAAYLSLQNNSDRPIVISRVASAQYGLVELHETRVENGVARMRKLPELTLPAGAEVTLQRGGKHLMLMRPAGPADSVTLDFFDGETLLLSVTADVKPRPD